MPRRVRAMALPVVVLLMAAVGGCRAAAGDARPDTPPPSGTASGAALPASAVPGTWQVASAYGSAVPRLALCREPLPEAALVSGATTRTLSSRAQLVRDDVYDVRDPASVLARLARDLEECGRFTRGSGPAGQVITARPAAVPPGLVAGRMLTTVGGRVIENLVIAGVRDGSLHIVTIADDRAPGAGTTALAVQAWLLQGAD